MFASGQLPLSICIPYIPLSSLTSCLNWGQSLQVIIICQKANSAEQTCDEHQVTCGSVESLCCAPETNTMLNVNDTGMKKKSRGNWPSAATTYTWVSFLVTGSPSGQFLCPVLLVSVGLTGWPMIWHSQSGAQTFSSAAAELWGYCCIPFESLHYQYNSFVLGPWASPWQSNSVHLLIHSTIIWWTSILCCALGYWNKSDTASVPKEFIVQFIVQMNPCIWIVYGSHVYGSNVYGSL